MAKKRIVSLLSSATEMVFACGLQQQLVGVSHECDFPPAAATLPCVTATQIDSSLPSSQIDVQVRERLRLGQPLYGVDRAALADLQPDVILTQAQCKVCAIDFNEVRGVVESDPRLSAVELISLQPNSLDDMLDDVLRVAQAAGDGDAGARFRRELETRIAAVADRAKATPAPRTAVIEWSDPLMIAGNWTPALVRLAGGEYPPHEPGEPSRYWKWSELVDYAPEVLIVAPCGFELARCEEEAEQLSQRPEWRLLPAVRDRRVHVMDGNAYLNRSGPRLVDSLEMLARLLAS